MKLVFRKATGEVVMVGQEVENKNLSTVDVPYDQKMEEGYQMLVKDGSVEYIKPVWMRQQKQKNDLKTELENAKTLDDLKKLIGKIINA
jgi:hypothetical protein